MTTTEEARKEFENLGFNISEYVSYVAPINDSVEIFRLQGKMAELSRQRSPKENALLETLLDEQMIGTPELLVATKTFDDFRVLPGNRRPYMTGFFTPSKDIYELNFMARNLQSESHHLKNAGRFMLNGVNSEFNQKLEILMNAMKKNIGISSEVSFGCAGSVEIIPPFFLQTSNLKLDVAYDNMALSLRALGYSMKEL